MGTVAGTIDLAGDLTVSAGTGATLATVDDNAVDGTNSLDVTSGTAGASGNVQIGIIGGTNEVLNVTASGSDVGSVTLAASDLDGTLQVSNTTLLDFTGAVGGTDAPSAITASTEVDTIDIGASLTADAVTLGTTDGDIDVTATSTVTANTTTVDMGDRKSVV